MLTLAKVIAAASEYRDVCFWPKADIRMNAFSVAFGGKADMPFCTANVRLRPKADIEPDQHQKLIVCSFPGDCDRPDPYHTCDTCLDVKLVASNSTLTRDIDGQILDPRLLNWLRIEGH